MKEWKELNFANSARTADNRTRWKGIAVKSSVLRVAPRTSEGHGMA